MPPASIQRRYNHWTAVRNGLMNAHAELFVQIPAIVKTLPDPIDQMKFFELIQIHSYDARQEIRIAIQETCSPAIASPIRGS